MGTKVERHSKKGVYRSGGGLERGMSGLVGVGLIVFLAMDGSKWHVVRHAAGAQAASAVGWLLIGIAVIALGLAFFGWRRSE